MTEELRDVLLARFDSVYSGYGATDIEIVMAGESPVSIAVRRLARARPDIGLALFGTDSRLPMVFQYNPLETYLETTAEGALLCTINSTAVLTPRRHPQRGVVAPCPVQAPPIRAGLPAQDRRPSKRTVITNCSCSA